MQKEQCKTTFCLCDIVNTSCVQIEVECANAVELSANRASSRSDSKDTHKQTTFAHSSKHDEEKNVI